MSEHNIVVTRLLPSDRVIIGDRKVMVNSTRNVLFGDVHMIEVNDFARHCNYVLPLDLSLPCAFCVTVEDSEECMRIHNTVGSL